MATLETEHQPRRHIDTFNRVSRAINAACAHPAASATVFTVIVIWLLFGQHAGFSETWQLVMNTTSSVVTFLMVFVIANAQKRDTDALLLKLDLLIAANPDTKNTAVALEEHPEHIVEAVRQEIRDLQDRVEGEEREGA